MKVAPYLIFNGNAEEAAKFYAPILGGKIDNITRYGDTNAAAAPELKARIIHLCLVFGDQSIGMADTDFTKEYSFGTGNIITLHCDSQEQIESIYAALSKGGQINTPLLPTFFAKQYADFVDRFGVAWCLMLE